MKKHPMQGNSTIQPITHIGNGPSTPEQCAEWCNNLAASQGINRTDSSKKPYLAPATAEDFA